MDNKIFKNILKIALHYNLPIIIHGSEPLGHKYKGKGRSYPKFLFKLVEKNQDNIFIFSHFGGGLVFYEQMPEIKKISTNVYYDSAAQPFLYDKSIYRTSILSSSINKILFASDFPLIDLNKCLKQTDYLTDIEKKHIFSNVHNLSYSLYLHLIYTVFYWSKKHQHFHKNKLLFS